MRPVIVTSLALASTVVSAAAILPRQDDVDDRPRFHKDVYCGRWDRSSAGAVHDLWFETEAGWFLDHWLKNRTGNVQHNWFRDYERHFGLDETISGTEQCSNIFSDSCDPGNGMRCEEYFDMFNEREGSPEFDEPFGKSLFWIFENVKGMRQHLKTLRGVLADETMFSMLMIDEMIEKLNGVDEIEEDPFGWIMGAIGMGIQLIGLPSGLETGGSFGKNTGHIAPISNLFTGALGMMMDATTPESDDVDPGVIRAALGRAFKKSHQAIDKNLRLMLGILREEEGEDADTFRELHVFNDKYDVSVGQFFGSGLGLLMPDSQDFQYEINMFRESIQSKVADHILQEGDHVLIGDDTIEESDCEDSYGARWLEHDGTWYCWFVAEREKADGMVKLPTLDDEFYDSMEEYHLSPIERYYEAVIACGNNGDGEHTVDTSDMVVGEVPHCLFNLPVYTSEWNEGGSCGSSMGATCGMYRTFVDL